MGGDHQIITRSKSVDMHTQRVNACSYTVVWLWTINPVVIDGWLPLRACRCLRSDQGCAVGCTREVVLTRAIHS